MTIPLRRLALTCAVAGGLLAGGLLAAAPASAADGGDGATTTTSPRMSIQYGPFSSEDACYIHRYFNTWPYKSDCYFLWDDRHPIGYYYHHLNP